MRVECARGRPPKLVSPRFYCSSYFLVDEADVQSCLYCSCTYSCSLTRIHTRHSAVVISSDLLSVCSTSLLLCWSLWIMHLTSTWISAFQCKPSSNPSPLLSNSVFSALGAHFTVVKDKYRDHHTEWKRVNSINTMAWNREVRYKNAQQWAPTQR